MTSLHSYDPIRQTALGNAATTDPTPASHARSLCSFRYDIAYDVQLGVNAVRPPINLVMHDLNKGHAQRRAFSLAKTVASGGVVMTIVAINRRLVIPLHEVRRCHWARADLAVRYHDEEWGVPLHDDRRLFEFLALEGAQAGLSWDTILKKRANYRVAFDNFDPLVVSGYDRKKVLDLLGNSGIVRNRLKIDAAIRNAQIFLQVQKEFGGFDAYVWQFVGGRPRQNSWRTPQQVPARTPQSDAMSKDMMQRGFKFVGSTICYAFMQAVGMVNDHLVKCFRYAELKRQAKKACAEIAQRRPRGWFKQPSSFRDLKIVHDAERESRTESVHIGLSAVHRRGHQSLQSYVPILHDDVNGGKRQVGVVNEVGVAIDGPRHLQTQAVIKRGDGQDFQIVLEHCHSLDAFEYSSHIRFLERQRDLSAHRQRALVSFQGDVVENPVGVVHHDLVARLFENLPVADALRAHLNIVHYPGHSRRLLRRLFHVQLAPEVIHRSGEGRDASFVRHLYVAVLLHLRMVDARLNLGHLLRIGIGRSCPAQSGSQDDG